MQAMKAYGGSGSIAPFILTSAVDRSGQPHALTTLFPGKELQVPTEQEAGWVPGLVLIF